MFEEVWYLGSSVIPLILLSMVIDNLIKCFLTLKTFIFENILFS